MLKSLFHIKPQQRSAWLAMWVVICFLGQALLPTFAYTQSDSNPRLWDEICSVYGSKSINAEKQSITGSSKNSAPTSHVDCPLCLHVFNDIVIEHIALTPQFYLLLISQLSFTVATFTHPIWRTSTPEARGPPVF